MYFKEKEDTNIDNEFEKGNKFKLSLDPKKIKPILLVVGSLLLIAIIISVVISLTSNNNSNNQYTIELVGEKDITISLGQEYTEPGYKAYDEDNNDVTNQVEITSDVDTTVVGQYEVLYSIGNTDEVRYVFVKEVQQVTHIRLEGTVNMYLSVGEKYVEPGYKAYDSKDANITEKVQVSGTVDTSKAGIYIITYTVVNSKNITTTVKRTVVVNEK